jgi:trehalose 6-phosphate phosphatase
MDGMSTPDELIGSLRQHLGRTLIALDFDGTLAPIVADPAASRPVEGTVEVLQALAAQGAQVAVITGRDAHTVLELGGLHDIPGLIVEGVYGAERWQGGRLTSPPTPERITALRIRLPELLAAQHADPDIWIEDKRLSLVVHGRKAHDPGGVLAPLQEPVATLAGDLGFEVHAGRGVIELRLPGFDKGAALTRLIEASRADRVLFAGDDLGDLPAFEVVAGLRAAGRTAWALAVRSDDVPEAAQAADVVVSSPAEVVALLRELV